MKIRHIPHSKPTIETQDISAVSEVLASGQLADCSQVALFEKELSSYIGHKGGVATNSGTNALHLALLSLGHNDKDEVIIPSYTCTALLSAVYAAQLKPRIVDINEYDYNISLSEVEKAVSYRSKAIIAPHMFGDPIGNVEDIIGLGLPVIEDCALSVGATLSHRKVGGFSQLSIFSFYATKVLTAGHGGMILSSSQETLNTLRDFMQYDNREEYGRSFNFRLTDFQAALGRSQLYMLDSFIAKRREIAGRYDSSFRNVNGIGIPSRAKRSIYFRYIIEARDANEYIEKVSKKGVECRKPVFRPLHHYLSLDAEDYPNTERAYKHNVSIPIYPTLKDNEIEYVINTIGDVADLS